MKDYLYQTRPLDFRNKISSVLLDDDDEAADLEIPFSGLTDTCAVINANYLHYVHLKNCKKSKSIL